MPVCQSAGKLEIGNWKLEIGNWKLEIGNWKLEIGNDRPVSNLISIKATR